MDLKNRYWTLTTLTILFLLPWASTSESQTTGEFGSPTHCIYLTPDHRLITGSDRGLWIARLDPGLELQLNEPNQIASEIEKFSRIVASPDKKRIAVAGGTPAELGVIEIYSLPQLALIRRVEPFNDMVSDLCWNSDSAFVAGSMTGNCYSLELGNDSSAASGRELATKEIEPFNVHSKSILTTAHAGNGVIVSGGKDNSIRVWKTNSENRRVLNNHVDVVCGLATRPSAIAISGNSPTSKPRPMIVSISHDATARFWQPTIGRMVRFTRLPTIPTQVIWTPDGAHAIVGTRDGSLHWIDPKTAKITQSRKVPGWIFDMVISTDGRKLLLASQNGVFQLDISSD
ncbi:MAG: WD40 repeat protein [Mariniblastus sp.]|jgi:WD40 repeat protein